MSSRINCCCPYSSLTVYELVFIFYENGIMSGYAIFFYIVFSVRYQPSAFISTFTAIDMLNIWSYAPFNCATVRGPHCWYSISFYRAMHFSAKRGIAIACRLSVRLSVRPSVRPSVTMVNCDHIGWNSSKIISRSVSLGCSLFATQTSRVYSKGNTPKFSPE